MIKVGAVDLPEFEWTFLWMIEIIELGVLLCSLLHC